jgi:hypothetical protein
MRVQGNHNHLPVMSGDSGFMSLSLLQPNVSLKVEGNGMMSRAFSGLVASMRVCKLNLGVLFAVVTAVCAALPTSASAYATLEGPPTYSSAPGLPDGRVYELVSPADDDGNEAGASALTTSFTGRTPAAVQYSVASAEGDSVLFEGTGPMGETASPDMTMFVATRTGSGWKTRSLLPSPLQTVSGFGTLEGEPKHFLISSDFSKALVTAGAKYALAPGMPTGCFEQLYLAGSDPFTPATWMTPSGKCEKIDSPNSETGVPAGGSPDFSTVYFSYRGRLLPEDSVRSSESWGFYEESEGTVREAGVLPNDTLDPLGAVPAVSLYGLVGNQVSADGSRAFFVSPNPEACTQSGGCASDPPELYVREDGTHSVLVSRDTLLPEVEGLPAAAPHGTVSLNKIKLGVTGEEYGEPYILASVDGSQVFFQSKDRLTGEAPENTLVKTYDFDVNTGGLTYLPGVTGKLVGTDTEGSSLVFVRPASNSSPAEVDLWKGPGSGSVTPITQLPGSEEVEPVRLSSDGSVVVFTTPALISGFNNGGSSARANTDNGIPNENIYRYDSVTNMLGCMSCSPAGITPASASMSDFHEHATEGVHAFQSTGMLDARGISANGDRVFFETSAPLVPQDVNTNTTVPSQEHENMVSQGVDVYEWENGVVYLISSGKSGRDSYFLDNSESGNDVFFTTTEGLVANDTDGGYSVYDARVPRPGDNPLPAATPCEGSACQGPPRVQSPLAAPTSATFSGIGNPAPEAVVMRTKAVAKKAVACKKNYVKKKDKCVKQKYKKVKAKRAGYYRRAAS